MTDASTRTLIDDLRAVVADAEALIEAGLNDAGGRAEQVRERAQGSVDKARARLDELEEDITARAKAASADAARYIRDNPLQSVGIAAAAGIVIGLVLSRR